MYTADKYCHVQNEDQMAAFGGFGKVKTVQNLTFGARKSTGQCGWPNGFFKRATKAAVYRMYGVEVPEFDVGNQYCHVVNETQMIRYGGYRIMREVSASSDLGIGRTFTGGCPEP